MQTITIVDPVTRIEGHMKVEIAIDTDGGEQKIVDAHCTGTLFRGFETLLNGRNPLDAPVITPQIRWVITGASSEFAGSARFPTARPPSWRLKMYLTGCRRPTPDYCAT